MEPAMPPTPILYPMFALAGWTSFVLLLIPLTRLRAALRGAVKTEDFKYGEGANVPAAVSLPNRNYMNLLELPQIFYIAGLIAYVAAEPAAIVVQLAWSYVAARIAHSIIHLTYNNVAQRGIVFALSNFLMLALWVEVFLHLKK